MVRHWPTFEGWLWDAAVTLLCLGMDVSCAPLSSRVGRSAVCIPVQIICCLEDRPLGLAVKHTDNSFGAIVMSDF